MFYYTTRPANESRETTIAKLEQRQKQTMDYATAIRKHIHVVRVMSARSKARIKLSSLPKAGENGSEVDDAKEVDIPDVDEDLEFDEQLREQFGYFRIHLLSDDSTVWSPSLDTFRKISKARRLMKQSRLNNNGKGGNQPFNSKSRNQNPNAQQDNKTETSDSKAEYKQFVVTTASSPEFIKALEAIGITNVVINKPSDTKSGKKVKKA